MKTVIGGWSRMLRDLLRMVLAGPSGLQTVGAPITVKGQAVAIFAKLVCLLGDGEGVKLALQWNGASSIRPCFRHWNLVKKDHWLSTETGGKYVAVDCCQASRFQVWSEADLREAIDVSVEAHRRFAAGGMPRSKFDQLLKSLGYKATEHGLLADEELRRRFNFIDVLRYDWAHTFLADSMVGKEMWELIQAAATEGLFSQEDLYAFLDEPWEFAGKGKQQKSTKWNQLKLVFNEWRRETNESHGAVKAGMSELLGLYSLLRHFVETRVGDTSKIGKEVEIFLLTCKAVDLLLAAKKRRVEVRQAGAQLLAVLEEHMELRTRHYGSRGVTPKFHWAFDVAECMIADGFVVDAFALERVHLRVKSVATNLKNTRSFESSLLAGATSLHFGSFLGQEGWATSGVLDGKLGTVPEAPGVIAADKATYFGEAFAVGTLVCRGYAIAGRNFTNTSIDRPTPWFKTGISGKGNCCTRKGEGGIGIKLHCVCLREVKTWASCRHASETPRTAICSCDRPSWSLGSPRTPSSSRCTGRRLASGRCTKRSLASHGSWRATTAPPSQPEAVLEFASDYRPARIPE